jgi:hypothetical protein
LDIVQPATPTTGLAISWLTKMRISRMGGQISLLKIRLKKIRELEN